MTTDVIDDGTITVIEIGVPGAQGPPGSLIEVAEESVVAVTPVRTLDFQGGFDVSNPTPNVASVALDLSEIPAAGELDGTLDVPIIKPLHSGSTHQSIVDEINAHEIDVVGAHDASAIAVTPFGSIAAADVQSALEEVSAESGQDKVDTHAAEDDPHTGYQKESEKGAASGYASLDADTKVPSSQLPAFTFGNVFTVASQAEMLALSAQPGDIAIRTDSSQTFLLGALPASTLSNWHELLSPTGGVTSVNTRTGAVTGVQDTSEKAAANGYASLDSGGTVPDAQLPSAIARDSEVTGAVSSHEGAADPHAGYVLESLLDAKGDLIAASGADTPAKLTAGDDDTILMADAAAASGLKWAAPSTPSTQAFGDAAAAGTADTFTRGDHKHAMPSERAASSTTPAAIGTGAVGTEATDARADHVHATGAGTPSTQAFGDSSSVGSGPAAAMTDHKHAMPSQRSAASATPAAIGTAVVGTGTTDARDDHVHATGAGTPSTQAFGDSAATGSGPAAAMTDHKHAMPSLGTTAAAIGTSAGGSATTPSKSDHVHATGAGTPSTQAFGDAAAVGTGPAGAMTDHKHAMPNGMLADNGRVESVNAVGNTGTAQIIALTAGNVQTYTVNGNCTFTMPSGLVSGKAISFTVILTDSGGPRTIAFTGVKWNAGNNPTAMSAASAIDIFTFLTIDGGTTWYGATPGLGMAV